MDCGCHHTAMLCNEVVLCRAARPMMTSQLSNMPLTTIDETLARPSPN